MTVPRMKKLTRSITAKGSTSSLANCAMSDDGTTSFTVIQVDAISTAEVGATTSSRARISEKVLWELISITAQTFSD